MNHADIGMHRACIRNVQVYLKNPHMFDGKATSFLNSQLRHSVFLMEDKN